MPQKIVLDSMRFELKGDWDDKTSLDNGLSVMIAAWLIGETVFGIRMNISQTFC